MKLIDADRLIAAIRRFEKEFRSSNALGDPMLTMAFADGVGAIADLIVDEVPTVEERKHGHWIYDDPFGALPKCSECGRRSRDAAAEECCTTYCPHCGAKMDEEV